GISKRYARGPLLLIYLVRLAADDKRNTRMEYVPPKMNFAATCAGIARALGGCRSSSTGMAGSPFMAPDRVPAPNTRALLPGQAPPHYQSAPLPAWQSAANPTPTAIAALPNDVEARTASGRTLVWGQSGTP